MPPPRPPWCSRWRAARSPPAPSASPMSATPRCSPRMRRRSWSARRSTTPPSAKAVAAAEAITSPAADAHGPAEYRTKMAGVMLRRALARAKSRASGLREEDDGQDPGIDEGERQAGRRAGRAAHAPHPLPPRGSQPHRPAYRLRDQPLRRLHGRHRRQVGEVLHAVRRPGRRWRGHHHRGHRQSRRHAARAAGRLPRDARAAMRLLHAGHDHPRLPAARRRTRSRPRTRSAHGISGNICRCTGYQNIVRAIQYAAAKLAGVPFQEAAE